MAAVRIRPLDHLAVPDPVRQAVAADPDSVSRTLGYENLSHWLGADTGDYWISGKAGSSKSTLMKLACNHRGMTYALKALAGDQALGVALEISGTLLLHCKCLKVAFLDHSSKKLL
jgi:hypothetical protein